MSNINCINKNSTDYMFEDTAGRTLIGPEQTTTAAVKAYAVGELFWMNDTLYRVTSNIASGGTIVIDTNCVATNVSAELANRINKSSTGGLVKNDGSIDTNSYATTTTVDAKQNKTLTTSLNIEGNTSTAVEDALGKLNDYKAGLTDLAPAFSTTTTYAKNDCVTYNGQVYRFNQAHTGAWVASHADQIAVTEAGGHTMIPATENDDDVDTIKLLTYSDASDEKVVNAYTIKKWSNVDAITLYTTLQAGTDTIGAWNDNWKEESPLDRSGWIWHTALLGILSDNDVDFQIVFNPSAGEAVSLYAYRVDDNYTPTGETKAGGCVAIKFNNAPSTDVTVGISLSRKRTTAIPVTPLT